MKTKLTFLFALLCIGVGAHAQKVKIKDGIASVDGKPYIQFKTESIFSPYVSIAALNATTDEIFASYLSYNDPNKVTSANKDGSVHWIELNFLTLDLKCEIDNRVSKGLVKFLYVNNIYTDGTFNEENARLLVQKYGMRFSENRPNGVTVIINN